MRDRLITGIVLAVGLLVVLVLPVPVGLAAFAIMVLAGAWEWAGLAGAATSAARFAFSAIVAALMVASWWLLSSPAGGWLPWVSLTAWLVCLGFILRYPVALPPHLAAAIGLIVLPLGWLFLSKVHSDPGLGPAWVLALFGIVACADMGAYFAGRSLGRRPLAPAVSPKKTWEGVVGGLLAAGTAGLLAGLVFSQPGPAMIVLGLGVAAVSIVGDLTVSMFKRTAGLKDSGSLLPGHGGVLDRTDSLLAAVPLFFLAAGFIVAR